MGIHEKFIDLQCIFIFLYMLAYIISLVNMILVDIVAIVAYYQRKLIQSAHENS